MMIASPSYPVLPEKPVSSVLQSVNMKIEPEQLDLPPVWEGDLRRLEFTVMPGPGPQHLVFRLLPEDELPETPGATQNVAPIPVGTMLDVLLSITYQDGRTVGDMICSMMQSEFDPESRVKIIRVTPRELPQPPPPRVRAPSETSFATLGAAIREDQRAAPQQRAQQLYQQQPQQMERSSTSATELTASSNGTPQGVSPAGAQCNVPGCGKKKTGQVTKEDDFGEPGDRCTTHGGGGIRCMVEGCKTLARMGGGGRQLCFKHGGGMRCEIPNCGTPSLGAVDQADQWGGPGRRCGRHGGDHRCSFPNCQKYAHGYQAEPDTHGPPGLRCKRHL